MQDIWFEAWGPIHPYTIIQMAPNSLAEPQPGGTEPQGPTFQVKALDADALGNHCAASSQSNMTTAKIIISSSSSSINNKGMQNWRLGGSQILVMLDNLNPSWFLFPILTHISAAIIFLQHPCGSTSDPPLHEPWCGSSRCQRTRSAQWAQTTWSGKHPNSPSRVCRHCSHNDDHNLIIRIAN